MMFKKFRKYLVVLMAVVLVASFAVVPIAAAITYQIQSYVYNNNYVTYWREVFVTSDGNEPHWCEAYLWEYGVATIYPPSKTDRMETQYWGMIYATVTSDNYSLGIYADECQYSGAYGPL